MGSYRVLEEIALADCALEIDGRDLPDLFGTAAAALAQLMVDPATLHLSVTRRVTLRAAALDLLLYEWLSELIFLKDRDREVFPRASVRIGGSEGRELDAHLIGGVIDRDHTALRSDPKAVTLHRFSVEPIGAGWRARVVIDI